VIGRYLLLNESRKNKWQTLINYYKIEMLELTEAKNKNVVEQIFISLILTLQGLATTLLACFVGKVREQA
jgi:hypothetical protein